MWILAAKAQQWLPVPFPFHPILRRLLLSLHLRAFRNWTSWFLWFPWCLWIKLASGLLWLLWLPASCYIMIFEYSLIFWQFLIALSKISSVLFLLCVCFQQVVLFGHLCSFVISNSGAWYFGLQRGIGGVQLLTCVLFSSSPGDAT